MQGGKLTIIASNTPNKNFGIRNQWITDINKLDYDGKWKVLRNGQQGQKNQIIN